MALARRDEPFWWTTLDHGRVLYLQYNQVVRTSGDTSLGTVVDELRTRIDRGGIRRLVIDLRNNPGGDNHTYAPLLEFLRTDRRVNRPGGLSVIIGPQTFSAATNFATEVDRDTAAVFVGEPTGGRPNLYGDVKPVELPNSGLTVEVSSRYWEFGGPDDHRPWIAPDIPASRSPPTTSCAAATGCSPPPCADTASNPHGEACVPRTGRESNSLARGLLRMTRRFITIAAASLAALALAACGSSSNNDTSTAAGTRGLRHRRGRRRRRRHR